MTEKDLLHVMQNINGKYSDEAQARASDAQLPVRRRTGLRFGLIAAGAAACLGLTVIAVLPNRADRMSVASSDMTAEVAEVKIPDAEASEAAVTSVSEIVKVSQKASDGKPAAKSAVAETTSAKETEAPASQTTAVTEAAKTVTEISQTAAEPAAELPIIGDFDLDGKFTLADGVWCDLIYYAQLNDVMDMIPLTDAQIRQADMIPGCISDDNPAYPLGRDEEQAILATLYLIYSYDLTGITPPDYLADQNYYDDYTLYRSPRLVRELPIDWASLGLTGDFTEDDFWRAVSPEYALERYEEENGPLPRNDDSISDFLNAVRVGQDKYHEMIAELMVRERDKWEDPIYDYGIACERCIRYAAKLHQQKFGEPGYDPSYEGTDDPRLNFTDEDLTWDKMLKVFEEAKTYTDFAAKDFRQ